MRSLKYCVALVWILAAAVVQQCAGTALQRWTVQVNNEMQSGQSLFLHCKSKNDDLGEQNLAVGGQFSWSFKENFWQTTLFWCYMRNQHSHVALEVFWADQSTSWLTYRCNEKICIWSARDDGIYLKNIPENKWEFHTKWEAGW